MDNYGFGKGMKMKEMERCERRGTGRGVEWKGSEKDIG